MGRPYDPDLSTGGTSASDPIQIELEPAMTQNSALTWMPAIEAEVVAFSEEATDQAGPPKRSPKAERIDQRLLAQPFSLWKS